MLIVVKYESSDCRYYVPALKKVQLAAGERDCPVPYVPALKKVIEGSDLYRGKITTKNLCVTVEYNERSKSRLTR